MPDLPLARGHARTRDMSCLGRRITPIYDVKQPSLGCRTWPAPSCEQQFSFPRRVGARVQPSPASSEVSRNSISASKCSQHIFTVRSKKYGLAQARVSA